MATTFLAVIVVLVLATAGAMPPPPEPAGGLGPFGGGHPMDLALGGQDDGELGEDAERQSVLWRAMPKRLAPAASPSGGSSSIGGIREILGRMRMSNPKKSAQFTPTGVLAEGTDGDMISDPGPPPSYPFQRQYADDVPGGYPSSGVTREIAVRQGRLVGVVRSVPGFGDVHQFLGLPYAEPPVGSQRFMPPASPSQWKGLKVADRFGHVCPQVLPDLTLHNVSAGRLNQVQRLLPYLQDQSEDCLYLNVYAPAAASSRSSRLPVIVYIHGESLEWNAGTPYDGSVLAAYGNVIVVTFNFRLGILGFLRPGVHDNTVSNFGLLDQVAALQWVKDNIEALGGDPHSVTLMGHSTGAACAALLLVSPVSSNLFKRAILMSGTALSDWALTPSPLQFTIQVAEGLNCPLSDELAACLRKKRLSDLLAVKVIRPPFKTPFGPVVDGSVIPNDPVHLMGTYRELFSRYELLLGVTEQEAYHLLDSKSLAYGVVERDRDAMLKRYTYARFEKHPDVVLARTLAEYAHDPALRHPVAAEGQRDLLLDILSDARVAAPVVRTAELHAKARQKSFLYVFTHRTKARNYPAVDKSVQGDEMAYVLGLPLTPASMRPGRHFTLDEKHLAEQVITLWTNFAKTGDPNIPRTQAVYWPEFDLKNKAYLNLSVPTSEGYRYREDQMNYWNHELPNLLRNPQPAMWPGENTDDQDGDDRDDDCPNCGSPRLYQSRPRDPYAQEEDAMPRQPVYGTLVHGQGDTPQTLGSAGRMPPRAEMDMTVDGGLGDDQQDDVPRVAASTLAMSVVIVVGISFLLVNMCAFGFLYYKKNRLRMQQQFFSSQCRGGGLEEDGDDAYTKKSPTAVDGPFGCTAQPAASGPPSLPPQQPSMHRPSLGQRFRILLGGGGARPGRRQARGAGVGAPAAGSGHSGPPGHSGHGRHDRADSKDDLYEAVRSASRSTSRMGRSRTSKDDIADVHSMAKVRDWVAQEVVQRCSPGFLRRGRRASGRAPLTPGSSIDHGDQASISASTQRTRPSSPNPGAKPAVKKVSVAVDATPGARSSSVLRQLPIEFSKSMDETTRCGAQGGVDAECSTTAGMTRSTPTLFSQPSLQAVSVDEPDGGPTAGGERRRSVASIHLDLQPSVVDIVVAPQAPASPPTAPPAPLQSFVGPHDVNVTSREEAPTPAEVCHEDALDSMRRRNYPKVLPDFPGSGSNGPAHQQMLQLSAMQLAAARRRSLPPGQLQMMRTYPGPYPVEIDPAIYGRTRPAPPPRISSTLGRRPQQQIGARVMLPSTPEQSFSAPSSETGSMVGPGASPPVVRFEPRVIIRARDPVPEQDDATPSAPPGPGTPGSPGTQTSSSSVTLRRPEPRVIIKATSTNPVRPCCGDYDDYGFTKPHPTVHMQQAEDFPTRVPNLGQPSATPSTSPAESAPLQSTPQTTAQQSPNSTPKLNPSSNSNPPAPVSILKTSSNTPSNPNPSSSPTLTPKLASPGLGSPPTIAPKPVLKRPQPNEQETKTAVSINDSNAKPNGSVQQQQKSPQGNRKDQPAASLKTAGGTSAQKAPPTPPPLPSNNNNTSSPQKQQKHNRKPSDANSNHSNQSKTGTIKKGKKK